MLVLFCFVWFSLIVAVAFLNVVCCSVNRVWVFEEALLGLAILTTGKDNFMNTLNVFNVLKVVLKASS